MTRCKPGRSYPFKLRRMCYTSPTSGRVACGNPSLHCDKNSNKEFTMVRQKSGGTRRMYDWKPHFAPA